MKERAFRTGIGIALMLALSTNCARHLPIVRPYPPPTTMELGEVLAARQKTISTMNARVRATSWLGGDRVRATVLMLVDRQGRLRFEAEISLQGTVAVLATDGQRFAFLDTMRNELRRGPACPANVASLIRIPLGPADIAAVLLGDTLLPGPLPKAGAFVDWDSGQGADVLAVPRKGGWLRILFQREGGALSMVTKSRIIGAVATASDGRVNWRVSFEDFVSATANPPGTSAPTASAPKATAPTASAPKATAPTASAPKATAPTATATGNRDPPNAGTRVAMPQTIRFVEGDASFDDGVEIKFKDRNLNDALPDSAFELSAPSGTATVHVGCGPAAPNQH